MGKKEEAGLIHSSGGVPDVLGLRSVYPVITYDWSDWPVVWPSYSTRMYGMFTYERAGSIIPAGWVSIYRASPVGREMKESRDK